MKARIETEENVKIKLYDLIEGLRNKVIDDLSLRKDVVIEDGYLGYNEGQGGHNNDIEFVRKRKASEGQIEVFKAFETIHTYLDKEDLLDSYA
tara:strand:- start:200 stop:478 length:279 start_codon:yes stop_codon:yes gene_type:complete